MRLTQLVILTMLVTAVLPAAAVAQSGAAVAGVDASRLQVGTDSLAIYLIRGRDTIRTGTLRDELRVNRAGADARLIRIYRAHDEILGSRVDTIVNEYPSLRPLSQRSRASRSAEYLQFEPDRVTGWLRLSNGDSIEVDVLLAEAVFGAASFDLVVRAAPLAAGWSARVPAFLPGTRTVANLAARVVGAEEIDGEECWRVDADYGGTPVSFWIARETRRLCRQVMQLGPGVRVLFGSFPPPATPFRPAV